MTIFPRMIAIAVRHSMSFSSKLSTTSSLPQASRCRAWTGMLHGTSMLAQMCWKSCSSAHQEDLLLHDLVLLHDLKLLYDEPAPVFLLDPAWQRRNCQLAQATASSALKVSLHQCAGAGQVK
jgi:hypothetical protein